MICNYQNITDYCLNKFTYQYANIPTASSGDLITSVIRTDKDTGEVLTISPDTNLFVEPCNSDDLVEVISFWECYTIYATSDNSLVKSVDEAIKIADQNTKVLSNYDTNSQDGVVIDISGFNNFIIDGSMENQIHLGNIFALANILYNENSNNQMPYILDINNVAYYFDYASLKNILTVYFTKVTKQKIIKDDLVNQINTKNYNENLYYCYPKVSENFIKENKKIDISTYKEPINPPQVCDPPCDPNSCESCVNGSCESLCGENECCNNGACGECECEEDADCAGGERCCAGECCPVECEREQFPATLFEGMECPDGWSLYGVVNPPGDPGFPGGRVGCCPPGSDLAPAESSCLGDLFCPANNDPP